MNEMFKCNENLSIERARGNETEGMHLNSIGCGKVGVYVYDTSSILERCKEHPKVEE